MGGRPCACVPGKTVDKGGEAIRCEPAALRSNRPLDGIVKALDVEAFDEIADHPCARLLGARAVASEHDEQAGTARGPNTIFAFALDGLRVCHFGDFGQSALRPEQAQALGAVDLLILPVGGGPTIGAQGAAEIVDRLRPRWVVPMHYRTPRIGFLETADAFLDLCSAVHRLDGPAFETGELPSAEGPLAVVPAAP